MPRGSPKSAFTILELLLVIVIMSLLMGILLPALFHARQAAMTIQCEARQSQLMLGTIMFAQDHKDYLPYPNWRSPEADEGNVGWLYAPPVYDWTNDARRTGSVWNYVRANDVYKCQAHVASQEGSATITSFLMNGAVVAYGDLTRGPRPFRLDQFKSKSAIYWDAEDVEIQSDQTMSNDRSDGATWPGALPLPRHGNAINVAVVEGAVFTMTMDSYQSEQIKTPGMLWCVPNSRTGGAIEVP